MPGSPLTRIRRIPQNARYDRETIYAILDEALVCQAGFIEQEGEQPPTPLVIPTIHARQGDVLYLHGASASRLLKRLQAGTPVCVSVTLLDGIVFARSVFNHSLNYRSVVLFGPGRLVTDEAEKLSALHAISEHVAPGRWQEARPTSRKELKATAVVAIQIEQASAKVRSGPPDGESPSDQALPVWGGVLPLALTPQPPQADAFTPPDRPIPPSVEGQYRRFRKQ